MSDVELHVLESCLELRVLELTNYILPGIDALFLFHVHIILEYCLF